MRITFLALAALVGAIVGVSRVGALEPVNDPFDRPCCCPCPGAIYCSPVFHMPLQPAPSVCDGGFYYFDCAGRCYGPNYCLRPPFNPIQGFDQTLVGQTIFAKVMLEQFKPKNHPTQQGQGHGNGSGHGIGNYNGDFANPQNLPYFNPGNQAGPPPYAVMPPPPGFAPGMPGFAPGMPGFPPGYPGQPGLPPPLEHGPKSLIARGPTNNIQLAGYGPYSGNMPYGNPWVARYPTQAPTFPPAAPPVGYGPGPVAMPNYPGYAMPQVGTPNYAMQGIPMPAPGYGPPYVPLPGLPAPGYAGPNVPLPGNFGYTPQNMPNVGYTPSLPAVGYEPPLPPPTTACYPSHSLVRSPRDFFMWSETMEDATARQRRPALIP